MQGAEDRAPGEGGHIGDFEGGVPARFSARCIDQTKLRMVEQESDRNVGFSQQAFHPGLGCRLPVAFLLNVDLVEVRRPRQTLHEHEPWTIGVLRLKFRNNEAGPQEFLVPRQRDIKRGRRLLKIAVFPVQHGFDEVPKIGDFRNDLVILVPDQAGEKGLVIGRADATDMSLAGQ